MLWLVGGQVGWTMKTSAPADVFVDFDERFTVGEGGDLNVGERLADVFGDVFGELSVGGSGDDFE